MFCIAKAAVWNSRFQRPAPVGRASKEIDVRSPCNAVERTWSRNRPPYFYRDLLSRRPAGKAGRQRSSPRSPAAFQCPRLHKTFPLGRYSIDIIPYYPLDHAAVSLKPVLPAVDFTRAPGRVPDLIFIRDFPLQFITCEDSPSLPQGTSIFSQCDRQYLLTRKLCGKTLVI